MPTGGREGELIHSGIRNSITDCGINTRHRQELRGVLRTTSVRGDVTCAECRDALAYFDTKVRTYAPTEGPPPALWRFGQVGQGPPPAGCVVDDLVDQERLQRLLDKHCGRAESAPPASRGEDD